MLGNNTRCMIKAQGNNQKPRSLIKMGFPDRSAGKESPCNAGDTGEVGWSPGLERSPGGGNGNPLQSSCFKKPHGQRNLVGYSPKCHTELDTTERLSKQASSSR